MAVRYEEISKRGKTRRRVEIVVVTVVILIFAVWTIAPFVVMFVSSLKDLLVAFAVPRPGEWSGAWHFFKFNPTLHHYKDLFTDEGYFPVVINSAVASFSSATIAVVLGSMAGYALSRGRIPGAQHFSFWIISTRMAPMVAVMVPLYAIFSRMGLLGAAGGGAHAKNLLAVILAYTTFNLPFAIWMLRGFFEDIPKEIEEAAWVDGDTRFSAFRKIVQPLAAPGLVATFILCVLFAWNDFIFAAVFAGQLAKTIPVATVGLSSVTEIKWGGIMASGTLLVVPMFFLGFLIREYLVHGMTMGAVRQ